MERIQRTRLLSAAVLGVVLLSGVVLGLALEARFGGAPDQGTTDEADRSRERTDERHDRRTPLYRQVGELTSEQEVRIEEIIEVHQDSLRGLQREFDEFRERYNSRYSAIMSHTRESIKTVLTPEQAERYDSLFAEFRRSRRRDDGSDERRK